MRHSAHPARTPAGKDVAYRLPQEDIAVTDKPLEMTRRGALMAAAGAAAAPLLGSALTRPAEAAAPLLGSARPTHYRFKLGAFEVTTIFDGAIQVDGPHPIFGQDQDAAAVQALAAANFLPETRMEIGFTPVIVNTGSELVLFDSGNGAMRRGKGAGLLRETLAVAGYKPEQIDIVVLTHFHPDHIGGLMEDGAPAFPNARYVTGQVEYDFWSPPEVAEGKLARVGKLVQSNVVPLAEKMTFIKPDGEVASGIRSVDAMGHTPGHLAFHIESEGRRLLLWADTTNHYVASLQQPDWHVRFDMDKAKASAARRKVFDMVATEKIPATGYHMPFPSVGYVEKKDGGYRWVPASYQLNL